MKLTQHQQENSGETSAELRVPCSAWQVDERRMLDIRIGPSQRDDPGPRDWRRRLRPLMVWHCLADRQLVSQTTRERLSLPAMKGAWPC